MTDATQKAAQKARRPKRTPEQELAYLADRMAKIRAEQQERSRKAETREKIVIGGAVVRAMRRDPELRSRIAALLETEVTRGVDREAIASWLSPT